MPILVGSINPIGRVPAFVMPVFREYPKGNRLIVQRINRLDVVAGFDSLNTARGFEAIDMEHATRTVMVGDAALWAFLPASGALLLGTADEIGPELGRLLRRGDLVPFPLLENEVAAFCGADDIRERSLRTAYEYLGGNSSVGAGVWRDTVILRPTLCLDLASLAGAANFRPGHSEFEEIVVTSKGNVLEISIPSSLMSRLGNPTSKDLGRTHSLARVFGLEVLIMNPKAAEDPSVADSPTSGSKSWLMATVGGPGFSSGRYGQLNAYPKAPRVLVGPFGVVRPRKDSISQSLASIGHFFVLRNSEVVIEKSLRDGLLGPHSSHTISIVIQRTGFGSPQSSTVLPSQLYDRIQIYRAGRLSDRSIPLFFVGGHVLQRDTGMTPDLAASRRGQALALSTASAIMALANAARMKAPTDLFGGMAERGSLGLALRRQLRRGETPLSALQAIMNDLLHPEARIERAREAFLVVSPSIAHSAQELLRELTNSSHMNPKAISLLELPAHSGRPQVSFIVPNVPFERPQLSRFGEFCTKLLSAIGWKVEKHSSDLWHHDAVAFRDDEKIYLNFLIHPDHVRIIVRSALKYERPRCSCCCIITNFTPSDAVKQIAAEAGFSIVHYSRFNEWFKLRSKGRWVA